MADLALPTVTLCAAASVNIEATVAALDTCMKGIRFADSILFTDADLSNLGRGIRRVQIKPLKSASEYSQFLLHDLVDHVETPHCLIVQWDGFVLDPSQWRPEFLDYDYIGAPWPQFSDGHSVGNGGFSLRSKRLLEACRDPQFVSGHPEDVFICRTNRTLLEDKHGMRFADAAVAERFAFERSAPAEETFGFHGVFNLIPVLGADRFWELYQTLDDRSTVSVDYPRLMKQLAKGENVWPRRLRLTIDVLADVLNP